MSADDRENARRLAIFETGQTARKHGYGPGVNPHRSGSLEYEIWNNGWNWQGGQPSGNGARLFVAAVAIVGLLLAFVFLLK